MSTAVLFDLGNTLVSYYRASEFRPILERAIDEVMGELRSRAMAKGSYEAALERALAENREAGDFRVMPLASRLERIFELSPHDASLAALLCEIFLRPIFAVGRVYEDTIPVLRKLRAAGYRTAIVSNAPWGSPPQSWRRELRRLGLAALVDSVAICGDVGWRKPAPQIFEHAAAELGVRCRECLFVGDDPRWDIEGSAAVGMRPLLIDRAGDQLAYRGERVIDLYGVLNYCV